MKILKSNLLNIFIAWIIFPIMLFISSMVIPNGLNTNIRQGIADLIVFVASFMLNKYWLHQQIHWINFDKIEQQIMTALPTIIFVAYLSSAMFFVNDMSFKIEILIMTILVGLAEEFCFRGLMIPLFLRLFRGRAFQAVLGSSVLFGLMHLINLKSVSFGYVSIQVIFAISFGLLLGTIYVKTNNLSLVIVLHMLKDLFPLLSPSTLREASKMQFSIAALVACLFLLVIALFISGYQTKGLKINTEV
ncbi:CPBP family intramembrane metalloprotease [Companilactobacillus allii]|uniref:CAAX prenyl protease 2/Lysostaphin resistance protein A-like domain-containing protein n=1 Tax=Companilactobacillus allii TaxID=1847728 RepID=A0A1P8PZX3_9LACO|nr:CPBP family intramembrane glutamic endopeptidase [Companilactobacillus allii]APX71116.1 hypothetical protein BTM29_00480 [Companilactobacillus allii]USQ68194.1 CPBP family intramembrane metalloprotease [Companilactobacillus allii]